MQRWLRTCVREHSFPFTTKQEIRGGKNRDREIFRWARGDFQMYIETCYQSSDFVSVAESGDNSDDIIVLTNLLTYLLTYILTYLLIHRAIIGHCKGCQNLTQIRMIASNSHIFDDN